MNAAQAAAAIEVYETLVEAIGPGAALRAIAIIDGMVLPRWSTVERALKKREFAELLADPTVANREAARKIGVAPRTIRRWRDRARTSRHARQPARR